MIIQLNSQSSAGYSNATVCNEPLFFYVERLVGELSDEIKCEASPFAFCVDPSVIEEAKRAISSYDSVEIGDGEEVLLRLTKNEGGNKKHIPHRIIKNAYDFFEECEKIRMSVIFRLMDCGVRFVSVDGVVVSPFAEIGEGCEIHPSTEIRGNSVIGKNCIIGPSTVIQNSKIGDGTQVISSHVYSSTIGDNAKIGPFCHIKVNSVLSSNTKAGAFVEIKNSNIGEKTSALHLTYIGDSDVGQNVNFGCGTITCNYDGKNKHRTTIGDNVFIGCNTNLVAPVTLGESAFVAAGSTIVQSIPDGSLGIARSTQTTKENWVYKKREEGKL